jgi:hypothetical protein
LALRTMTRYKDASTPGLARREGKPTVTAAKVLAMTAESHVHADDLFPVAEWGEFRESDTKAARNIVVLMVGIFVIGIMLYSIVLATL